MGQESGTAAVAPVPGYIAPEVLFKRGWVKCSDVFAAGAVLYEALARRHPFAGARPKDMLDNTAKREPDFSSRVLPADLSVECMRVLQAMLSNQLEQFHSEPAMAHQSKILHQLHCIVLLPHQKKTEESGNYHQ